MSNDVTVGLIGCGKIGKRHLKGYADLDGVSVLASDIDESKKKEISSFDGTSWHGGPEGLLTEPDIDIIDVCTPVFTHVDIITEALELDKNVFCEKPVARTVDEVTCIKEVANSSAGDLMIGYLYKFHPAFQYTRNVLDEGTIGEPYYAIFRVGGRGSHRKWKHMQETGGGAANEMLVHMLDLIFWYFGDYRSVENLYTDTVLERREIDGEMVEPDAEDYILLNMEMEDGSTVFCQSDLITPSFMNYVEIHGSNGSIWTTILDHFPTVVYCQEPRGIYDRGNNIEHFSRVNLFEKELEHFIETVRNGEEIKLNSIDDAIRIRNVIEGSIMKETES